MMLVLTLVDVTTRRELSKELRCNVMGYDYSGYGWSSGQPTVAGSIADLEAAYTCLLQRCAHRMAAG